MHCLILCIQCALALEHRPKKIIDSSTFTSNLGKHIFELELHEKFVFKTHILYSSKYILAKTEEYPISTWAPIFTQALKLMSNLQSFAQKGNTENDIPHLTEFTRGQSTTQSSLAKVTLHFGDRSQDITCY